MKRIGLLVAMLGLGALAWSPGSKTPECPSDMVPTGLGSCIDRFEWPNQKGVKPLIGVSGIAERVDLEAGRVMDAERLCASVGKRVCRRYEWVTACQGPNRTKYPFGSKIPKYSPDEQNGLCNYDKWFRRVDEYKVSIRDPGEMKRLDQSEPSGSRETCQSASGAYDMMGNAEEWVKCPDLGVDDWCLMGRYWSSPQPCQFTITKHSPRWHYYESGFRCCLSLKEKR